VCGRLENSQFRDVSYTEYKHTSCAGTKAARVQPPVAPKQATRGAVDAIVVRSVMWWAFDYAMALSRLWKEEWLLSNLSYKAVQTVRILSLRWDCNPSEAWLGFYGSWYRCLKNSELSQ